MEATRIESPAFTFSQVWRASRRNLKERLDAVEPFRFVPPYRIGVDHDEESPSLSVSETWSLSVSETWDLIESLPEIGRKNPFTGRGFRDDYMNEQIQPILQAWRNMELRDVESQVDRLAEMWRRLFTGKRTEYLWWLTEAAAAVDADLGMRTMKRLMYSADHNAERVYACRIRACGVVDLDQVVFLLGKVSSDQSYLSQGITRLASFLPIVSSEKYDLVHKAVQENLARMSSGYDLDVTLVCIGLMARELDDGRAYDLIASTFQTLERTKVEPKMKSWQSLLSVVIGVSSGANLFSVLSLYSGPVEALVSLHETMDGRTKEEIALAITNTFSAA